MSAARAQVTTRDHRDPNRRRPAEPAKPMVRAMAPQSGPVGTSVTIRGRFPADTEIYFARRPVTPTERTRRSIKFVVPRTRPGSHALVLRSAGADTPIGRFQVERGSATTQPPLATHVPPPKDGRPHVRDHRRGAPIVTDYWPRQGRPGTLVNIQGRRFSPQLQVVYGGVVLPPTRLTQTAITVKIPRREGDGVLILKRPGARRDVAVGAFDVVERAPRYDRRRIWAERRARAQKRWRERQRKLRKTSAELAAELARVEAELARRREERRRARRAALRAKWEAQFLTDPEVRAEMALHAERTARLARMLRLAEAGNHGGLAVRINVLIETEDARHDQRMADLKAVYGRRRGG